MKIDEVVEELQKIRKKRGNIHVILVDDNSDPYEVMNVEWQRTGRDDYPESYGMPEGFEFAEIKG